MIGISHIALNVKNLEAEKSFYNHYFGTQASSPHYQNVKTGLETCFLTFKDGSRLELMNWPEMKAKPMDTKIQGYVHIAISLGSREAVDICTSKMVESGVLVLSCPRTTGDGYYESLVQDPEGNLLELTV